MPLQTAVADWIAAQAFRAAIPDRRGIAIIGMCETAQTWYRHDDDTTVEMAAVDGETTADSVDTL